MTFADYAYNSVSASKILVELDISSIQLQWVNIGAGIWKVNFDNIYPEVDSSLLDYFTVQIFDNIGSCRSNDVILSKVVSIAKVTTTYESFYYENKTLYVSLQNYDEPFLHTINIGIIHGFSREEFTPKGINLLFEGRLTKIPSLGFSRDPLYFGKIAYDSATLQFINADGEFDTFADTYDVYGNAIRIKFGYADLNYDEYEILYAGYIETIKIDENYMYVTAMDNRKKLTKKVRYTCTNKNALDAIYDLLLLNSSINYSETYFNTTEWDIARALVPNVTIIMDTDATDEILKYIEGICLSCFGIFIIEPDGKYTFRMIDSTKTSTTYIPRTDILTDTLSITYDPSQVLSSTHVGYQKNPTYSTWLTDISWESDVYKKYKVYIQNDFDTYLVNVNAAQIFSDKFMEYCKDVHGEISIDVPMKYYDLVFGGIVNVYINRENSNILGLKKCEILGKKYNLEDEKITLDLRIIESSIMPNYENRLLTDGDTRVDTYGNTRLVGV
jgi:VCBS repeat-containing protein